MKRNFLFGMMACFLALSFFMAGCQGQGNSASSLMEPSSFYSEDASQGSPAQEVPAPEPAVPAGTENDAHSSASIEGSQPSEGSPAKEEAAESPSSGNAPIQNETVKVDAEMKLNVEVSGSTFLATLEDNAAVDVFVEMMRNGPVVIQLSDYSGFEKVGSLGTVLPANDRQTTTQAGDIVLYNSNQIVIFYGSNSWSYTRLGRIDDLTGWQDALGNGDVTVSFSLAE